jgi:hypothetical protein
VCLRAGLDSAARGKIFCLCRGSNSGRPVCSQNFCSGAQVLVEQTTSILQALLIYINNYYLLFFPMSLQPILEPCPPLY